MDNDSRIFSFQMNDMYEYWPSNDMYGCSHNTLTQLQEKVLRSLSKKQEEDTLQVVPENDSVFESDLPSPYVSVTREAVCREKSAVKECHNKPCYRGEHRTEIQRNINFPWSPRLGKSPLLSTYTSTEPLRTPTFPFSPLKKSPSYFTAPGSPLALMLLSPFGRKPSEDLSMYLPENFTPAATLERLERSVSTTVFEFPCIERNQDDCEMTDLKNDKDEEKIADEMEIDAVEMDICGADDNLHAQEVFFDLNESNCSGDSNVEDYDCGQQSNMSQNTEGRRKKARQKDNSKGDCGAVVGFRNGLERKRRSEMNSKYDKLRKCIPEIEERDKVSKILVLKSAVQYIEELQRQDELLTEQKNLEKLKNEVLLKNLVKVNSSIALN